MAAKAAEASLVRKFSADVANKYGASAAAKALKWSKYILTSKRETLKSKDQDAKEGKVISRDSELFKKQEVKLKAEQYRKYIKLLYQNRLLMDLYFVKTNLD